MTFVLYVTSFTKFDPYDPSVELSENAAIAFAGRPPLHEVKRACCFVFTRSPSLKAFEGYRLYRCGLTDYTWEPVGSAAQLVHTDQLFVLPPVRGVPPSAIVTVLPPPWEIRSWSRESRKETTALRDPDVVYWPCRRTDTPSPPAEKTGRDRRLSLSASTNPLPHFTPLDSTLIIPTAKPPTGNTQRRDSLQSTDVLKISKEVQFVQRVEQTFAKLSGSRSCFRLSDLYRCTELAAQTASFRPVRGADPSTKKQIRRGSGEAPRGVNRRMSSSLNSLSSAKVSQTLNTFRRPCGCPVWGRRHGSTDLSFHTKLHHDCEATEERWVLFGQSRLLNTDQTHREGVCLEGLSLEEVIRLADTNCDGEVGLEEWLSFAHRHPNYLHALDHLLMG
ncbi:hypothetical protein AGDE_14152 [Angomonas deanei]|nr:hypothetical protein AGDE_14152 [Angomonas deanei]|eukprot:EPY21338.1 hypothetical protein AGDE_14152 [Angomonas deanei]